MKRINSILLSSLLLLAACSIRPTQTMEKESENKEAKSILQGLWMDDVTETPLLRIEGDSIYYMDTKVAPVAFKIIGDSMITYGSKPASYLIKKQDEYSFWFQSVLGETLKLSKSETTMDSIAFFHGQDIQEPNQTVIQKDHVVTYNQVRYHGYAYINPTQIKVINSEITEEGLEIDNVYYDNIIHICVFEGKNRLFGQDIKKQHFEHIIPAEYFQRSILSDMDFLGVNAKGYQYQATVCIPNSASCYLIDISISTDGDITYELVL